MRRKGGEESGLVSRIAVAAHGAAAGQAVRITQQLVRQALLEATDGLPAGTRLPSIREIAGAVGTTTLTVQRTVTQLAAEGLLQIRERSGLRTVARSAPADASWSGGELRFATDSEEPHQRLWWEGIREEYARRYPELRLQVEVLPDSVQRDTACDAFERSAWSNYWSQKESYLELARFLRGELRPLQQRLGPHNTLLLNYRSSYLYCNLTLLRQHKMPEPAFTDFRAQMNYLQVAAAMSRKACGEPPLSSVQPVTLLGRYKDDLLRYLRGEAGLSAAAREALEGLVGLFRNFCFRHNRNDHSLRFIAGEAPFFTGTSSFLWRFAQQPPEFPVLAYPLLAADDALNLQPVLGAIGATSRYPLESLRLLQLLCEQDNSILAQGGIPFHRQTDKVPLCPAEGKTLCQLAERATPFLPADRDEIYLLLHILGGEIWRVLDGKREFDQMLKLTREYAAAYLEGRPPAPTPV